MSSYTAPLSDLRFALHDVLKVEPLFARLGSTDATADVVDAVLEEAGRFSATVLAPLNSVGDEIGCVLDHVRASGLPPTLLEATDVKFPQGAARGLEPGQSATFTCPFRSLIGHPINEDPGIAQRSEIYFQAKYDVPLIDFLRLTDNSVRFFLNTHLLPPRWTSRSQK